MKKTTKILLVLAAVVAMTIGAVSTVMAADDVIIATWEGNDKEGWTAKDADGKAITSTWAKADSGIWYYFDNLGEMMTNEFIAGEDGWYYVGKDGAMATGWAKFTDDEEDVDAIEGPISKAKSKNILSGDKYAQYGLEVWVYFDAETGIAMEDAWLQTADGLWYYFDEIIMVASDYTFNGVKDDDATYGFAPDGHMYVGWEQVNITFFLEEDEVGPINDTDKRNIGWIYYESDGDMIDAGWEKLGDEWYYFVPVDADSRFVKTKALNAGDTVAVANTYITDIDDDAKADFYFNKDCKMVKGAVDIKEVSIGVDQFLDPKKEADKDFSAAVTKIADNAVGFFFDTTTGAQKNGIIDGKYYAGAKDYKAFAITGKEYEADDKFIKFNENITSGNANIAASMLKDAIVVYKDKDYMYFDKDGNQVMNGIVDFYGLSIGIVNGKIVKDNGATVKVNSRKYNFSDVNGILTVGGKDVAFGASTDKTDEYEVTVKVADLGAKYDEELIIDALEGDYVIGQNVSYKLFTKYNLKFSKAVVKVDGAVKETVFNEFAYELKFAFPDLGELDGDEKIELEITLADTFTVKHNDKDAVVYAVGEKVTVTAADGYLFNAAPSAITGSGIASVTDFAYVQNSAKTVTYRNQITFTMPNGNVVITDQDVSKAYAVAVEGEGINTTLAYNLYKEGESVQVKLKDNAYVVSGFEAVYDDTDAIVHNMAKDTATAGIVSFAAIDADITVAIKAGEAEAFGDLYLEGVVTKAAVKVAGKVATPGAVDIDTATLAAIKTNTDVELSNIPVVTGEAIRVMLKDEGIGANVKLDVEIKNGKATVKFKMPGEAIIIEVYELPEE